jgi:hypothetical protein
MYEKNYLSQFLQYCNLKACIIKVKNCVLGTLQYFYADFLSELRHDKCLCRISNKASG